MLRDRGSAMTALWWRTVAVACGWRWRCEVVAACWWRLVVVVRRGVVPRRLRVGLGVVVGVVAGVVAAAVVVALVRWRRRRIGGTVCAWHRTRWLVVLRSAAVAIVWARVWWRRDWSVVVRGCGAAVMATALATAAHHLGCLFGFSMSMSEARQSRVRLPMNMVVCCHVDLMWSARANESRGDGYTYAGRASGLYPPRL